MKLPRCRITRPVSAWIYTFLLGACTVTEKNPPDPHTPSQGGQNGSGEGLAGASGRNTSAAGFSSVTVVGGSDSMIGAAGSQAGGAGRAVVENQAGNPSISTRVASDSGGTTTQGGVSAVVGSAGRNSLGGVAAGGALNAGGVTTGGALNAGGVAGRSSTSVATAGGTSSLAGSSGGSPIGGSSSAAGGATSTGSLPAALVGVWQQTRATSGDYVSSSGATFSLTSGFSVQLKLSSNGAYYLANLGSGVTPTCGAVSNFEQSVGTAELVGDTLVFHPNAHIVDVTDCAGSKHVDLGASDFSLSISLQEAQHFYGGIRTYRMLANGGPHPYDLMLVHRPPLTNPPVVPQPTDFTLGADDPYAEFQGLWVAAAGTDADFFNPTTGEYHFPELNGSPHAWLKMIPGGYETAIALQNVNTDGPCKSDVIYYEQGEARFAVLEDVGGQGNHFVGHVRFQSTAARMIVRIRECNANDGTVVYDLPPLPRYFRFIYFSADAPPERISFPCDFELNEWQSILCEAFPKGFTRR